MPIVFQEEQSSQSRFTTSSPKGILALPIRLKLAKDEKSSQIVLLIIVSIVVIVAVLVWIFGVQKIPSVSQQVYSEQALDQYAK